MANNNPANQKYT